MKSLKAIELNMAVSDLERLSGEETLIICVSEGRREKDKAIREKQEKKFLKDAEALKVKTAGGTIKPNKVHESIGRLKERYSRVSRYYDMLLDDETNQFSYTENSEKKELAKQLDGSYIIRTDRNDLTDDEIRRTYMILTRVESAFRDMKTPLLERPIFHQLERRVQTHIFICVLAYHLLAFIEKMFRDKGNPVSWETVRAQLRTHQTATIVLPYKNTKKNYASDVVPHLNCSTPKFTMCSPFHMNPCNRKNPGPKPPRLPSRDCSHQPEVNTHSLETSMMPMENLG